MLPDPTHGGALLARLLSFLRPCILPMVPFHLFYMGGISVADLRENGQIAPGARRRLVASGIGMTAPFVVAALFAQPVMAFLDWRQARLDLVEWMMGAMLIVFAALIVTGSRLGQNVSPDGTGLREGAGLVADSERVFAQAGQPRRICRKGTTAHAGGRGGSA